MSAYESLRAQLYKAFSLENAQNKISVDQSIAQTITSNNKIDGGRRLEEVMDNILEGGDVNGTQNTSSAQIYNSNFVGGARDSSMLEFKLTAAKGENIDAKDLQQIVNNVCDKDYPTTDEETYKRYATTIAHGLFTQFSYEKHIDKAFAQKFNVVTELFTHFNINPSKIIHLSTSDSNNSMLEAVKLYAHFKEIPYTNETTNEKYNLVTVSEPFTQQLWTEIEHTIDANGIVIALIDNLATNDKQQLADTFSRNFESAYLYKPLATRPDCCCMYMIGINFKETPPTIDSNSSEIYKFEVNRMKQLEKYKQAIDLLVTLRMQQAELIDKSIKPIIKIHLSGGDTSIEDVKQENQQQQQLQTTPVQEPILTAKSPLHEVLEGETDDEDIDFTSDDMFHESDGDSSEEDDSDEDDDDDDVIVDDDDE